MAAILYRSDTWIQGPSSAHKRNDMTTRNRETLTVNMRALFEVYIESPMSKEGIHIRSCKSNSLPLMTGRRIVGEVEVRLGPVVSGETATPARITPAGAYPLLGARSRRHLLPCDGWCRYSVFGRCSGGVSTGRLLSFACGLTFLWRASLSCLQEEARLVPAAALAASSPQPIVCTHVVACGHSPQEAGGVRDCPGAASVAYPLGPPREYCGSRRAADPRHISAIP